MLVLLWSSIITLETYFNKLIICNRILWHAKHSAVAVLLTFITNYYSGPIFYAEKVN